MHPASDRISAAPVQEPAPKWKERKITDSMCDGGGRCNIWAINLPTEQRRPIVLDAASVSYNDITERYSGWRVLAAINWAQEIGHRVTVLAPNNMLVKEPEERGIFANIEAQGILEWLAVPETSNSYSENPDLENHLLARARELDAAIVSERSFSGASSEFHREILQRVIGFCFFRQEIFIPVDPYGRSGPKLREILTMSS
uniref:RNase_Zc3h12a domain-containing protein n=1 Tax=Anopheles albimanus TaxID=7167 RepID=A0A182FU19_ANOAL